MRDWRGVGAWVRNDPADDDRRNRHHRQRPPGGGGGADTFFRRAVRYAAGLPRESLLALRYTYRQFSELRHYFGPFSTMLLSSVPTRAVSVFTHLSNSVPMPIDWCCNPMSRLHSHTHLQSHLHHTHGLSPTTHLPTHLPTHLQPDARCTSSGSRSRTMTSTSIWPAFLRSLPPTPSPHCRAAWSASRCTPMMLTGVLSASLCPNRGPAPLSLPLQVRHLCHPKPSRCRQVSARDSRVRQLRQHF